MSDPYRLGPALLQIGDDSTAHAPETFRSALLRALDSPSRVAVAHTCRAGFQWLLSEWTDSAALQLSVRSSGAEVPDSATLRRMHRANQWLLVRQDEPMSLALVQQGQGPSADGYWGYIVVALGSGHALPGLRLSLQIQHIPASLLQLVGSAFPGLTTLSLGTDSGTTAQLPPPTSLPALRYLAVQRLSEDSQAALWASVAPYLLQLTSLSIGEQPYNSALSRPQWAALFSAVPAIPSTTLTHLSLAYSLEPWLASALCERLPALATLSVTSVSYEPSTDAPVPAVCPWHTLVTSRCQFFDAWLPLPASGRLVVDVSGAPEYVSPPWLDLGGGNAHKGVAAVYTGSQAHDKLSSIELRGRKLMVWPGYQPRGYDAEDMGALVPHLASLASPDIELVLGNVYMEAELADILHQLADQGWTKLSLTEAAWFHTDLTTPLPPLHTLSLSKDCEEAVDEDVLTNMVQCITSAELVSCAWEDDYVPAPGTVLPWRTTRLFWINISTLVCMAEAHPYMSWEVETLEMNRTIDQVESGEYLQLAQRLRNVRLTHVERLHLEPNYKAKSADHLQASRACLAVARALPCPVSEHKIRGFSHTPEVVAELEQLPKWRGKIRV